MSNGFYFINNGYYPSAVNFDMTQGTPWSVMNAHMNFALTDMQARMNLYNVPLYNFNNFSQYPQFGNSSWLLDPNYALNNWAFNNAQNGGWNMAVGGNNWNSFPDWQTSPWGSNQSGSKPETAEDKEINRKINKLLPLLKELRDNGVAGQKGSNGYEELEDTIRNYTSTKPNEGESKIAAQYRVLKEAYDKLNPAKVREILTKGADVNNELREIGYEFKAYSDADKNYVKQVKNEIDAAIRDISETKNGGDGFTPPQFITNINSGEYGILEALSRWNTENAGDRDHKNIVEFITNAMKEKKIAPANKALLQECLDKLVNALTVEAEAIIEKTDINNDLIINEATAKDIKKLSDTVKNDLKTGKASFAENFDKLYIMLRIASATIVQRDLRAKYEFLDTDTDKVFDDDLFVKETKEDLKAEGRDRNVTIGVNPLNENNNEGNVNTDNGENPAFDTATNEEERIAAMVSDGIAEEVKDNKLEKLKEALQGNYELAESAYLIKDVDGKVSKVVILKDGELYELPVTVENNNFVLKEGTTAESFENLSKVIATDIKKEYDNAKTVKNTKENSLAELTNLTEGQNAVLEKKTDDNGNEYYEEKTSTGSFEGVQYKKRFYISNKDGKIYECKVYKENDQWFYTNIQDDANAKETTAKEIKEAVRNFANTKLSSDEVEDLKAVVVSLRDKLKHKSYDNAENILEYIDEQNVLQFAYEYNKNSSRGLFIRKAKKPGIFTGSKLIDKHRKGDKNVDKSETSAKLAECLIKFINNNEWAWKNDINTKIKVESIINDLETLDKTKPLKNRKRKELNADIEELFKIFERVLVK